MKYTLIVLLFIMLYGCSIPKDETLENSSADYNKKTTYQKKSSVAVEKLFCNEKYLEAKKIVEHVGAVNLIPNKNLNISGTENWFKIGTYIPESQFFVYKEADCSTILDNVEVTYSLQQASGYKGWYWYSLKSSHKHKNELFVYEWGVENGLNPSATITLPLDIKPPNLLVKAIKYYIFSLSPKLEFYNDDVSFILKKMEYNYYGEMTFSLTNLTEKFINIENIILTIGDKEYFLLNKINAHFKIYPSSSIIEIPPLRMLKDLVIRVGSIDKGKYIKNMNDKINVTLSIKYTKDNKEHTLYMTISKSYKDLI